MGSADSHRQLLVRCSVRNRAGDVSVRFIEHHLFRLWQYMMANKHGLRVEQVDVSLWMPEREWQAQQNLFAQVGPVEQVQRISLAVYDASTNLCDTLQRFVPARDAEEVKTLLMNRLPPEIRTAAPADYAMEVENGYAVLREDVADLATLGQPLTETRSA